jgi:hypothetical protein
LPGVTRTGRVRSKIGKTGVHSPLLCSFMPVDYFLIELYSMPKSKFDFLGQQANLVPRIQVFVNSRFILKYSLLFGQEHSYNHISL